MKWISTQTRMPKKYIDVLVSAGSEVTVASWIGGSTWMNASGFPLKEEPEAWMYFPEPYGSETA